MKQNVLNNQIKKINHAKQSNINWKHRKRTRNNTI